MNTVDEVTANAQDLAQDANSGIERTSALLLGGAAINLAIIAEAIPKLLASNPDPKAPLSLRELSKEERETIEALRSGSFVVVPKRP